MVEALTAVWTQSKAEGSDLLVFLAIANEYNHHYGAAWPTLDYLADMARLSERQVRYSLRKLEGLGELAVEPQAVKSDTGRWVNRYRILLPIAHRRGAKSAPISDRGGQSATSTGANGDTHNKEVPLNDPLQDSALVLGYINPKHHHRQSYFWCGEFFCIKTEQHLRFEQRAKAAGLNVEELDWPTYYRERDQEWGETDIDRRDPKGPMFWLAVRVGQDAAGLVGGEK